MDLHGRDEMFSNSNIRRWTNRRMTYIFLFVTGLLVVFAPILAMSTRPLPAEEITLPEDPNTGINPRAIGVEALPENKFNIAAEKPTPQSAALFVGVNTFSEDNGLAALDYAVNDAVEQAFVFVNELKLIKPENCILCLSGKPTTRLIDRQLQMLKQKGVEVTNATKPKILRSLRIIGRIGQSRQDMVIVSFSTHGFESRNGVYLMPTDGLRGFLDDTAIYSGTVKESVAQSNAGKKLLIIDACRERVEISKSSGSGNAMSERFERAFAASSGFATLMSCSAGQYSYEDTESGHGVFSKFLLKALRGDSPPDRRGFITVGTISEYVSVNVSRWMLRNRPEVNGERISTPALAGAEIARHIPLAIGKELTDAQLKNARMTYLDFYPPQKTDSVLQINPSAYNILLNNKQANLRSILATELKDAFNKNSLRGLSFSEDSNPLDGEAIKAYIKQTHRNFARNLIVCVIETADQGEKESYGAKFAFYNASVTVKIYDSKNSKLLHNFTCSSTRGSSFSSKAQQEAMTQAAKKAAVELIKWFGKKGQLKNKLH